MCQLFGMNAASAADFSFHFLGFCQRGGATDIHAHGFGISLYEGKGLRSFLDTLPACHSPIAQVVQNYPIKTQNMIAHIRYATTGAVSLENVHPFSRELWGIQVSFAHNGQVPKFDDSTPQAEQPYLGHTCILDLSYFPVGDTDSEAVFCAILNALKAEFNELPTLPVLHEFLSSVCKEIVKGEEDSTIFNFLLGFGDKTLFAYSWPGKRPGGKVWNGLYYLIRAPPFLTAQLVDVDYKINFLELEKTPQTQMAIVTTKPLTDEEGWTEFERGELLMFDKGVPYKTAKLCENVEREGRGLHSNYFSNRRERLSRSPTRYRTSATARSGLRITNQRSAAPEKRKTNINIMRPPRAATTPSSTMASTIPGSRAHFSKLPSL